MKVEKRPYVASLDEYFLYQNYVSVRWAEVSEYRWSLEEKMAFLQMQYHLKQGSYLQQYPDLEIYILTFDGEKMGHYMIVNTETEIRLLDIYVIPFHRSKGIGTKLMKDLMEEARLNNKDMTICVFYKNIGARSLCEKLGFTLVKEEAPTISMYWNHSELIRS